jgi:hypothetical protein
MILPSLLCGSNHEFLIQITIVVSDEATQPRRPRAIVTIALGSSKKCRAPFAVGRSTSNAAATLGWSRWGCAPTLLPP